MSGNFATKPAKSSTPFAQAKWSPSRFTENRSQTSCLTPGRVRWLDGKQLGRQLADRAADSALTEDLDALVGQSLADL